MLKLDKKKDIFTAKYRIYYEDTDAGSVVYYANYLKFFERARTDFLRNYKIMQNELLQNEKIAFVVKSCNVNFIKPAKLDDLIEVSVEVKKIGAASILMLQKILRNDEVLTDLVVEIVCVDADIFKPRKIPENIKNILCAAIEK